MNHEIYLNVAEKIGNPSALTQEDGNLIYNEITQAINQNIPIILDFEQIESMISPFLNNAIGQLYGKFTSEQISEFVKIRNFPKEKNSTLNIVIANAKKYYSNKEKFNSTIKEVFNS
ncbi:MAG: STAS-like domain-containing protein [Eubacterium sp.]|nr:STAS-like domain-containing protein [Eubacterium sp.]